MITTNMTGYEIAVVIKNIISQRMRKELSNELFRSRCDIKPAIAKLEQDITRLNMEIEQNNLAITFLKQFKG